MRERAWGEILPLDQHYASMIARLEVTAARSPGLYTAKVVIAGLVGYMVLGVLTLLFVAATAIEIDLIATTRDALFTHVRGLIVYGLLAYAFVRAFWVPRPHEEGLFITGDEAPALFAMLERVRVGTGGSALHAVRITSDLNASIRQESRFLLLKARNSLYLGLPLLFSLRREEVEAVVAHEFGHFAGRHGHASAFVYRIRMRWASLGERLPRGFVAGMLRRFFAWYGPWFASYSFVLARQQEYAADLTSATVAGSRMIADALLRLTAQSQRLGSAWLKIWDRAVDDRSPPSSPYRLIESDQLGSGPFDQQVVDEALQASADLNDTHPTLAQRLSALEEAPRLPAPLERSAATELLGSELGRIAGHFDAEWHATADDAWAEIYEERQAEKGERTALKTQIAAGGGSRNELFRFADLTETLDGSAAAIPFYEAALSQYPEADEARLGLGNALFETGDDRGIPELLAVAESDPSLAPVAYRLLIHYLTATERRDDADRYAKLLDTAETRALELKAASSALDKSMKLQPIDQKLRRQLCDLSRGVAGVAKLHAAIRALPYGKQQIFFLFAPEKGISAVELLDELIDALLPAGDLFGVARRRSLRWLAKRIEALPGSEIRA